MSYAFIRVRSLTASKLASCEKHNARQYEPNEIPDNIRQEEMDRNDHMVYNLKFEESKLSLYDEIHLREKVLNVKGVRADSVKAIEIVLTINDDNFFNDCYSPRGYFSNAAKWIEQKYGKHCIVSSSEHFDETRPHAHFVIMPLTEKEVHWKNRNGSGTKMERRYCAQDILGSPDKLRQLQSDYHEFANSYTQRYNIELTRGVDAREQTRVYTERTNHELAEISKQIQSVGISEHLEKIRAYFALKEAEIRNKLSQLISKENKADRDKVFFTEKIDKIPISQEKKEQLKQTPPEWNMGM